MKTIEELRKEFELLDFVKPHKKERGFVFNKKTNCFTDLSGIMTDRANWLNGCWFMFQELNK